MNTESTAPFPTPPAAWSDEFEKAYGCAVDAGIQTRELAADAIDMLGNESASDALETVANLSIELSGLISCAESCDKKDEFLGYARDAVATEKKLRAAIGVALATQRSDHGYGHESVHALCDLRSMLRFIEPYVRDMVFHAESE